MAKKEFSYEEAIQELEEIVRKFESEEYGIDELSIQVKKAAELVKKCREKLRATNDGVSAILEKIENEEEQE